MKFICFLLTKKRANVSSNVAADMKLIIVLGNSIVTDIHFVHFKLDFQTKANVQPKVIYCTTDLCHPSFIPGLGSKRQM